jgi:hypothetical protein
LWSFRIDPRAKIWHKWKPNIPLPFPINRFRFHGLREQKAESRSQSWEKTIFALFFSFFPSRPPLWLAPSSRLSRHYHHQALVGLPCNTRNVADHFSGQVSHPPCLLFSSSPPGQPLYAKFACSGGF